MTFLELITALAANGGAVICIGVILWFVWYRETKTVPQIRNTFLQMVREERQICQKWHEENQARHQEQRERLEQLHRDVLLLHQQLGDRPPDKEG